MKHKLSPWHSEKTKPVHVGMYEVKDFGKGDRIEYAVWVNGSWCLASARQDIAESFHESKHVAWIQNKQWRGIVK